MKNQPSNQFSFTVHRNNHGIRIDRFLRRQLPNYTQFRLQRIIRSGAVSTNKTVSPLKQRVRQNDQITIQLHEPPDKLYEAENIPLDILHEDETLIVINKQPGMITHPVSDWQNGSLCHALQFHFDQQTALRGILRPGIVHRLDRMTSGAIIVTKNHRAQVHLSRQFEQRKIEKTYLAITQGHLKNDTGIIDLPIGRQAAGRGILMSTEPNAINPKTASTAYQVIERTHTAIPITAVIAKPKTGRIHQIRVHMAAIGHPLIGDTFYNPTKETNEPKPAQTRHLLHALQITFTHPTTNKTLTITAPPPNDIAQHISPSIKKTLFSKLNNEKTKTAKERFSK